MDSRRTHYATCNCPHQTHGMELRQVGWMGPYGIIPGGMDVHPVKGWQPIYMIEAQPRPDLTWPQPNAAKEDE